MNNKQLKKVFAVIGTQVAADQSWKAHQREILLTSMHAQLGSASDRASRPKVKIWNKFGSFVVRPVGAFGVSLTLIFGGLIASVSASGNSMPGDLLYPLKLKSEKIQVSLVSDKSAKANLELFFAKKRIEEINLLIQHTEAKDLAAAKEKIKKPLESYQASIETVKIAIEDAKGDNSVSAINLAEQLKEVTASAAATVKAPEATVVAEDMTKSTSDDSVQNAIAAVVTSSTDAQLSVIKLTAETDLPKAKDEMNKYLADARAENEAIIKADEDQKAADLKAAEDQKAADEKAAAEAKAAEKTEAAKTDAVKIDETKTDAVVAPEVQSDTNQPADEVKSDEAAKADSEKADAVKANAEDKVAKAKAELEKIAQAEDLMKKDDLAATLDLLMAVPTEPAAEKPAETPNTNETVNKDAGDKAQTDVKSDSTADTNVPMKN